ncbi:MAG: T9SS type A sorting domain-containing protein [Bacteroidetes bacterium]|nr:T9SS type A sorting domain-containing protein [Bacteroidota bacterium]
MKKIICMASLLVSSFTYAQYPFSQNFDAISTSGNPQTGPLPTGWVGSSGFKVYGMENMVPHGYSVPNSCSVEMNSTNTQDTLITPMIGPVTANTKIGLEYRFVNKAGYPANGYQLQAGDKVTIDAYLGSTIGWQNNIASLTTSSATASYTTYTYSSSMASFIAGQNIQIRLVVTRASGDWYLDIDNFQVADNLTSGIEQHNAATPQISVYPNPSNGNFSIALKNYQASGKAEVTIYDVIGKKVKTLSAETTTNAPINVNTSDLQRGLYFVEVRAGGEVATSKIQID